MPIDSSIAMGFQQPKYDNPLNSLAQLMTIKNAQQEGEMGQLKIDDARRGVASDNALAQLLAGGKTGADVASGLASQGYGKQSLAYTKQMQEQLKHQAETDHLKSQSGKLNAESLNLHLQQSRDLLNTVNDPQSAAQWVTGLHSNPEFAPLIKQSGQTLEQAIAAIPQDPEGFAKWKRASSLGAEKLIQYTTPDANTQLTNTTHLQTTKMNNDTSVKTTGMTNATSRANNASTQAGENMRAGITAGGGLSPDMETTAKAIANGQLPPPTGMALLNPRNQRVLARVMEVNPEYDATTITAKRKAASDFTSGTQGNAMRSFAVAGQHLDQLGTLVDALDNGNMQVVNKLGNYISAQTGSPAPTNFDAAKDVVSKEVIKAIVGAGGGVTEREELAKSMSKANSPAQLKGVITQYRNLMGAQHDALLIQRRAAGLPDSTIPNYGGNSAAPSATPALPSGWSVKVK